MVYSDQCKFIFYAVPKTGSRSIQEHLKKFGIRSKTGWDPNHDNYEQVKKKLGDERCNEYFKFAFFRNPWSLLVSLFFHNRTVHSLPHNKSTIIEWIEFQRGGDLYAPYLFDKEGNMLLDFIGRFENINEDLKTVCEKINVPVPGNLPHEGKESYKGRLHYKEYYESPVLVEKIKNVFSKSLSVLKYEFSD